MSKYNIAPVLLQPSFKGLSFEQLSKLSIEKQITFYSSRVRRSIKRGFTPHIKSVLENLQKKKLPKIRSRNLIILPNLVGKTLYVYDGKTHQKIEIKEHMCGKYIGDFISTRKVAKHSRSGKGATKSSKFTPNK